MRQVLLWDTACNFNAIILNQSIFNRLITSVSTLHVLFFLSFQTQSLAYIDKAIQAACKLR